MTLVLPKINSRLNEFGFSDNLTGGHMARSMMADEISILCKSLPPDTSTDKYKTSILDENILGKPTFTSRQKSLRHLIQLYSLDPQLALFRVFRKFLSHDFSSLPQLGMVCAFCRDQQLRYSFLLIDDLRTGEILKHERMEQHFEAGFPNRYSAAMIQSLTRNVDTTWTVSGHLHGKAVKKRAAPEPKLVASIYAMFAGYLTGLRSEMLIESIFGRLVSQDTSVLKTHLSSGSARGWLRYRSAGGVTEIDFSPMLTSKERELLNGND
jgi:hypothetical protein